MALCGGAASPGHILGCDTALLLSRWWYLCENVFMRAKCFQCRNKNGRNEPVSVEVSEGKNQKALQWVCGKGHSGAAALHGVPHNNMAN